MKNFFKLVNFEISRFILIFSIMMGVIVACQFVATYFSVNQYVDNVHNQMKNKSLTYEQYVFEYGDYDITRVASEFMFFAPIMFGIAVLVLYVFFIWYRDWFGKATFMYRLLMLPTNRLTIYFAKLSALLLFIFTALAIEVGVLNIVFAWVPTMVPSELYTPLSIDLFLLNDLLYVILPVTLNNFVLNYSIGIAIVTVIFTIILFERSYRLKGIMYAILFAIFSAIILLLPVIYHTITNLLFIQELYILTFVAAIVTCTFSIVTANYLLKYKINV